MTVIKFLHNVKHAFSNVLEQFDGAEPIISKETQILLSDKSVRDAIRTDILNKDVSGEVTINTDKGDIQFIVQK